MEGSSSSLSTVHNALRLLQQFSYEEPVLGVSDLARRLNLAKSTTSRLAATLLAEGFLETTPHHRYRLGIRVYELGMLVVSGLELREVAQPVLMRLRNTTGETVHLAVLDGVEVVYLDRIESQNTLRLFSRIGRRNWAHTTSSGKAILAYSRPEVVEAVIEAGLPKVTSRTITSRRALLATLEKARNDGYVHSLDESEVGVSSVAAPIFGHLGTVVAAISVAGPSARLTPSVVPRVAFQVRDAAAEISRSMGFRGHRRAV